MKQPIKGPDGWPANCSNCVYGEACVGPDNTLRYRCKAFPCDKCGQTIVCSEHKWKEEYATR